MVDSQRKLAGRVRGNVRADLLRRRFGAGSGQPGRPGARQRPRDRSHGDGGRAHLGRPLQPRRDALDAHHRAASRRARPASTGSRSWQAPWLRRSLLLTVFPSAITDAANLGVPAVGGHGISTFNALMAEIIGTFFLVFVIYGVAVDKRGAFSILAGLPIGLTISIGVLARRRHLRRRVQPRPLVRPGARVGLVRQLLDLDPRTGHRRPARGLRLRPAAAQGHAGRVDAIPCGGTARCRSTTRRATAGTVA